MFFLIYIRRKKKLKTKEKGEKRIEWKEKNKAVIISILFSFKKSGMFTHRKANKAFNNLSIMRTTNKIIKKKKKNLVLICKVLSPTMINKSINIFILD